MQRKRFKQVLIESGKVNKNHTKFSKKALKSIVKNFKQIPIDKSYSENNVKGFIKSVEIKGNKLIANIEMKGRLDIDKKFIGYNIFTDKSIKRNKRYKTIYNADLTGAATCDIENEA